MKKKIKIPLIVIPSILFIVFGWVFFETWIDIEVRNADLPTITVTGEYLHWHPIDGPAASIIPEEELDIPMRHGQIYLYGNILSEDMNGTRVEVTGKLTENLSDYLTEHDRPVWSGTPSSSAIFVTWTQPLE